MSISTHITYFSYFSVWRQTNNICCPQRKDSSAQNNKYLLVNVICFVVVVASNVDQKPNEGAGGIAHTIVYSRGSISSNIGQSIGKSLQHQTAHCVYVLHTNTERTSPPKTMMFTFCLTAFLNFFSLHNFVVLFWRKRKLKVKYGIRKKKSMYVCMFAILYSIHYAIMWEVSNGKENMFTWHFPLFFRIFVFLEMKFSFYRCLTSLFLAPRFGWPHERWVCCGDGAPHWSTVNRPEGVFMHVCTVHGPVAHCTMNV